MKYTGTFNLTLLSEEMEAAGYVGVGNTGEKYAKYVMLINDDGVEILLRESTEYAPIDELIAQHDHTKKSDAEKVKEAKEDKKAQVLSKLGLTEEELRDLLS
jgi:hypothetical protein